MPAHRGGGVGGNNPRGGVDRAWVRRESSLAGLKLVLSGEGGHARLGGLSA